jgi:hypothetical protein
MLLSVPSDDQTALPRITAAVVTTTRLGAGSLGATSPVDTLCDRFEPATAAVHTPDDENTGYCAILLEGTESYMVLTTSVNGVNPPLTHCLPHNPVALPCTAMIARRSLL